MEVAVNVLELNGNYGGADYVADRELTPAQSASAAAHVLRNKFARFANYIQFSF